jgi:hypothetical protein
MCQAPVYPCWDEIAKYSGVLRARFLEDFRRQACAHGIEAQSRQMQLASGATQQIISKGEMEAHLRTPSCSGVSWLSIQDYTGQGEALVGWLDAFYDSKGIVTPREFCRYAGRTVPLVRMPKYCWTADERFHATAQVAHWGADPIRQAVVEWGLRNEHGATVAAGRFPPVDLAVGSVPAIGPIEAELKSAVTAARWKLELAIRGTEFANDWNLWVFPPGPPAPPPAGVVLCDRLDEALATLANGRRVVLLAHGLGDRSNRRYAQWQPVFWSATFLPGQLGDTLGALVQNRHLALAAFPTEAHLDWQWYDVCVGGRGFVLDSLPADYRPIVQPVSDYHSNHKLGTILEFRTPQGGRLLVCGYNLADRLASRPAARQLRGSLLDYAASPAFEPAQEVSAEVLTKLLAPQKK